ncbi:MAG: AAA family ATPase [Candidatus Micrarchaeota archaeon]
MVQWEIIDKQNPWWSGSNDSRLTELLDNYDGGFERKEIYERLIAGSVHLIKGPRQSGKTTYLLKLINHIVESSAKTGFVLPYPGENSKINLKAILYFSAEGQTTPQIENTLRNFFLIHSGFEKYLVVIDEITSIKEVDGPKGWASNLKKLIDEKLFAHSSLILTGSDANKLEQGARVMLGRGVEGNTHYLTPLAFREYILKIQKNNRVRRKLLEKKIGSVIRDYKSEQIFKQEENKLEKLASIISSQSVSLNDSIHTIFTAAAQFSGFTELLHFLLVEYIRTGGFPEAITTEIIEGNTENKAKIYEKTISGVLEKLELSDLSKENAKRILLWILDAQGQTISYNGIGKDVALKTTIVQKYFEALEQLQLITVITQDAEPTKTTYLKKAYLTDPMLNHGLRIVRGELPNNVVESSLTDEKILGQIAEATICNALKQHSYLPLLKETETFLHFVKKSNSEKELDFAFTREKSPKLGVEVKYQENINKSDIKLFEGISDYILVTKNTFEKWSENQIALPAHVFLAMLPTSKAFL